MKPSLPTALLATATAVLLSTTVAASIFAWQSHRRATTAELKLKVLQNAAPVVLTETASARPAIAAPDDSASLRRRVRELETELANRNALIASATGEDPVAGQDTPPQRGGRGRPNNNPTDDPQRAAEMQAQRDAFRQRMEQAMENRKNFFDRDPETLTPEMQGTYAAVRSLLDQVEENGRLFQSGDLAPEDRRELGATMRDINERLNPLMQNVRREEIMTIARDMGYDAAGQRQLVEFIENVYEATTVAPPRMGPPGGGFGGGGGGNRGGGRGGR